MRCEVVVAVGVMVVVTERRRRGETVVAPTRVAWGE